MRLSKAIQNNEIKVYYQPKIEAGSTRIIGGEALVRWQKADGSFIYPDEFIPDLEKSGKIIELDYFVYEHVFRTLRKRLDEGKTIVPISLNVSRAHMKNMKIYDYVKALFARYQIPIKYIEFELTESMYIDGINTVLPMLREYREHGGKISMDDFGSGYSSLNMLTDFPIDTLKIDKVFLKQDELQEKEKIILSCVISMAKKLKLDVLCEGVETTSQSDFLSRMGCDMFQGFLYSKPLPEDEFFEYMETHLHTEIKEIHFSFDGNLKDDTGNYEGIVRGNDITFCDGPAKGMKGLHFPGGEPFHDCIEFPVDIFKNDSFSINMWIKEEDSHLWSSAYYAGYENGFCNIMPKAWNMRLSFRIKDHHDQNGWHDTGDSYLELNRWIMVTACYDSHTNVSTLYMDGIRCGILQNVTNLLNPHTIYLGGDIYTSGFIGCISDLRFYNQALSFEMVRDLYDHVHAVQLEYPDWEPIVSQQKLKIKKIPLKDIHFPLNETLSDSTETYTCSFIGAEPAFTDGPSEHQKALYFPGGSVGENVLKLPDIFKDLEGYTISYWIKDENPRPWISTFYMETEHGFMEEIPLGPDGQSVYRLKDTNRETEWRDTLRNSLIRKDCWHHIILVYYKDIRMIAHYVDGEVNGQKDDCFHIGEVKQILFGGDIYQPSFEGCISDIHIFNQPLAIEKVLELTNGNTKK